MGFSVYRGLVSLLIALPLLMPPGMCVCQFLACERPSPARPAAVGLNRSSSPTASESDSPAPPSGCACSARQAAQSSGGDAALAGKALGPAAAATHSADTSGPLTPPPGHAPSCPASQSAGQSKSAATPSLVLDFAVELAAVGDVVFVSPRPADHRTSQPVGTADGPLYLAYRSLLI